MKDVEFFRWWIPDRLTGKPHLSAWKMHEEYAQRMYPGCTKDPMSREVRFIATTDEEIAERKAPMSAQGYDKWKAAYDLMRSKRKDGES